MPFGLHNAAQTFQQFVEEVYHDMDFVFVFINDILVFSTTPDQHRHQPFQRYGSVINHKKCELGCSQLSFLGHHIRAQEISLLASHIQAVHDFPQLVDKKRLREFLGMVNFYHHFIPHCDGKLHPLHRLLSSPEYIGLQNAMKHFNFAKQP